MPAKSLNLAGIFETAFAVCFDIRRILTLDAGIKNRQPPRTAVQADTFIAQPAAKHAVGEFDFGGSERAETWGHGWFINQ